MKAKPEVTPNQGKAYTLDYTLFRGTDTRFKAYEAGELDLITASGSSALVAASQGLEFKAVASLSRESSKGFHTQYFVKADSPIRTVADLKGKIIGNNAARSSIELWARLALIQAGLNPDRDVTWAVLPFPAQGEALRAGKIDIGAFPQPFAAAEIKKGGVRKLFTSKDAVPFDEELIVIMAHPQFIAKHAAVLRTFLADLKAATRYYLDKPQEARQALIDAKLVRIPAEIYLGMEDNYRVPTLEIDIEALGKIQEVLLQHGYQKNKIDPRSFVDLSYLK
jgi:ABC-type nitrate/sulfonate/bicarbonate transport system substrate-binding protein